MSDAHHLMNVVFSEATKLEGQSHRSSSNFSTRYITLANNKTPSKIRFNMKSFKDLSDLPNVSFEVFKDVSGGNDTWIYGRVYNNETYSYKSSDSFYIYDPQGATEPFLIEITAVE